MLFNGNCNYETKHQLGQENYLQGAGVGGSRLRVGSPRGSWRRRRPSSFGRVGVGGVGGVYEVSDGSGSSVYEMNVVAAPASVLSARGGGSVELAATSSAGRTSSCGRVRSGRWQRRRRPSCVELKEASVMRAVIF
jgi:hypothetical protein